MITPLLTTADVADYARCHPQTVCLAHRHGLLKASQESAGCKLRLQAVDVEDIEAKRDRLIAERAEAALIAKANELIEHRRQELLALTRLMSECPQGNDYRGRGRVEYQGTAHQRTPL